MAHPVSHPHGIHPDGVHPHGQTTPTVSPSSRRPALQLVKTTHMPREQWLAVRRQGIGGSDAPAALGLSPFQSALALWMDKTGKGEAIPKKPEDDSANDASPMYWGSLLEPIVAAHYTRRTGHKVRRINAILQHPQHPWMLANVDREVLGAPDVQLLECKTAGIHSARLWRDGVPEYVQIQVQHLLAVTHKQTADVAVLIGGQELQIHRIQRDEELIGQLITLERMFWDHVENDTPPTADGSDSADQALRALFPKDDGTTIDWKDDSRMGAVFSDLIAIREQLTSVTQQEARLKQAIQQHMGNATRAVFEQGEISWKRAKDGEGIDLTQLRARFPDAAKACSQTNPGSRRFLVHT